MIRRDLEFYLRRDAGYYPVVTLTGPRQSGKTTLAREVFANHDYRSLEDLETRQFAQEDPRGFLRRHPGPVVLDEVQRCPDLVSYIQTEVDRDDTPGRFVLTGSQNFLLMERISQSLAGRSAVLHLLPLSRSELEGQSSLFDTLRWWHRLTQSPPENATLLYGGEEAMERNGIRVRPWFAA